MEDISLLSLLKIEPANVLDQVLTHWNKYTLGDAADAHEQTVDDMYQLIHASMSCEEADRAEEILDQNGDRLAELVTMSALYLEPLLKAIPDEIDRSCWNADGDEQEHAFLRVSEIDAVAKIAILTSDTTFL